MIADALGVSKAAVYHQFKSKEEIVIATQTESLHRLALAMEAVDSEPSRDKALTIVIPQLVALSVDYRTRISTIRGDPATQKFLSEYKPFHTLIERMWDLLVGDYADEEARVRGAVVAAALSHAAAHALVADMEDDALKEHLVRLLQQFLDLPKAHAAGSDSRARPSSVGRTKASAHTKGARAPR